MIQSFNRIPYAIPFTFTDIDDDVRRQAEVLIPYNVAIYAITITGSVPPQTAFYHHTLQFQNYHTGVKLFDEPVTNLCLQADARTPWRLPSMWYVRKNEKIICSLDAFDGISTRTVYVTLLGYVVDQDPNPGTQPFVYSYPMSIGFQDNVESGSVAGVPFNQGYTGTLAKHMLHDFDIYGFVLDPFGTTGVTTIPAMALQLNTQRRKLFDRFLINGVAGGGEAYAQGDTLNWMNSGVNLHAFPLDNSLQYYLAKPERVCKGELVRVALSPAPTYVATSNIHTVLSEICCVAVFGNHYAS